MRENSSQPERFPSAFIQDQSDRVTGLDAPTVAGGIRNLAGQCGKVKQWIQQPGKDRVVFDLRVVPTTAVCAANKPLKRFGSSDPPRRQAGPRPSGAC